MEFQNDSEYWNWFEEKRREVIMNDCCKGGLPIFLDDGNCNDSSNRKN